MSEERKDQIFFKWLLENYGSINFKDEPDQVALQRHHIYLKQIVQKAKHLAQKLQDEIDEPISSSDVAKFHGERMSGPP